MDDAYQPRVLSGISHMDESDQQNDACDSGVLHVNTQILQILSVHVVSWTK